MSDHGTKILHIMPHLGGGAGRVVLNYLSAGQNDPLFIHQIATLDFANQKALDIATAIGVTVSDEMSQHPERLLELIAEADIVLMHWWNHPLLYDFLVRSTLPPCRLIMWSHVAGFTPPYVFTKKILNYSDWFVFTTPLSWQAKEVRALSPQRQQKFRSIWSTAGINYVENVKPVEHKGFNVGYIGTVDYAKLHPDFLQICAKIDIPGVKFIVCGGSKEAIIKQEAEDLGIADKFNFTGEVSDIKKYLSIFDVFGYPLSPNHYGTCDQVLAESMAAGVVPVVLDNPMEKNMIKDEITGLVAKDATAYVEAIVNLYKNNDLLLKLSNNAREYAKKVFSVENMAEDWQKLFLEVLTLQKSIKKWPISITGEILPKDIFLESLGKYGLPFIKYCQANSDQEKEKAIKDIKSLGKLSNWRSSSKGTVHQYLSFFLSDKCLAEWSLLMK